ncbi:hypothetical protein BDV96DRAFT_591110 [Lophiotrema nucula]|uniref:Uncharacterized protein n=1 Tax=Lophiotrema nucula TaxID=690887 RepID=A0A6A5YI42_9PLEO|nr:hypothetical protein BDV96DRAFT_591110 [Lophiotrema nucula]
MKVLLEPTTLSASSSTFSVTGVASSTSTPQSIDQPSTGLSSGAKIAIGISIPLALITAAIIAFLFLRHRRKRATTTEAADPLPSSTADQANDPGTHFKAELEGDQGGIAGTEQYEKAELAGDELGGKGGPHSKAALKDGNNGEVHELPGGEDEISPTAARGSEGLGSPVSEMSG